MGEPEEALLCFILPLVPALCYHHTSSDPHSDPRSWQLIHLCESLSVRPDTRACTTPPSPSALWCQCHNPENSASSHQTFLSQQWDQNLSSRQNDSLKISESCDVTLGDDHLRGNQCSRLRCPCLAVLPDRGRAESHPVPRFGVPGVPRSCWVLYWVDPPGTLCSARQPLCPSHYCWSLFISFSAPWISSFSICSRTMGLKLPVGTQGKMTVGVAGKGDRHGPPTHLPTSAHQWLCSLWTPVLQAQASGGLEALQDGGGCHIMVSGEEAMVGTCSQFPPRGGAQRASCSLRSLTRAACRPAAPEGRLREWTQCLWETWRKGDKWMAPSECNSVI